MERLHALIQYYEAIGCPVFAAKLRTLLSYAVLTLLCGAAGFEARAAGPESSEPKSLEQLEYEHRVRLNTPEDFGDLNADFKQAVRESLERKAEPSALDRFMACDGSSAPECAEFQPEPNQTEEEQTNETEGN